jgi:hypothetical protein
MHNDTIVASRGIEGDPVPGLIRAEVERFSCALGGSAVEYAVRLLRTSRTAMVALVDVTCRPRPEPWPSSRFLLSLVLDREPGETSA